MPRPHPFLPTPPHPAPAALPIFLGEPHSSRGGGQDSSSLSTAHREQELDTLEPGGYLP